VAQLCRRATHPSRHPETTFEHFSIPAFDAERLPAKELGASIKSGKYALDGESVLLSKINPRIARTWFAVPTTEASVASTEFLPWRGKAVSNAWLWATFSDGGFRSWLVGAAGGTSTSHQRAKPDDVASYPVRIPDRQTLRVFDSLAEPALRETNVLRRHNQALARTRDLLLPRLVTGRLDVSKIDLDELLSREDGE